MDQKLICKSDEIKYKNIDNTEKRNNTDQIWEGVCYFSMGQLYQKTLPITFDSWYSEKDEKKQKKQEVFFTQKQSVTPYCSSGYCCS